MHLHSSINRTSTFSRPFIQASFSTTTIHHQKSSSSLSLFGGIKSKIVRIELDANQIKESNNVLLSLGVPTFQAKNYLSDVDIDDQQESIQRLGLEAIVPDAFVLKHVFTRDQCEDMIKCCEDCNGFENYSMGKNHHGAMQMIIDYATADGLLQRIGQYIDKPNVVDNDGDEWQLSGINRRLRIYRYRPNGEEVFLPHIDSACNYLNEEDDNSNEDDGDEGNIMSRFTVLIYLNDDFNGGHTNFYAPMENNLDLLETPVIASVKPVAGSVLIFPQAVGEKEREYAKLNWPMHEGSIVTGPSQSQGK